MILKLYKIYACLIAVLLTSIASCFSGSRTNTKSENINDSVFFFKKHKIVINKIQPIHVVSESDSGLHASGKITPSLVRFFMEKTRGSLMNEPTFKSSISIYLLDNDQYLEIKNGSNNYMSLDFITNGRSELFTQAEKKILVKFDDSGSSDYISYTRVLFLKDERVAVISADLMVLNGENYNQRDIAIRSIIESVRSKS